jgi:glyoxylase-like metal-dependent hydrolase (beta-lactamase superfamily II)
MADNVIPIDEFKKKLDAGEVEFMFDLRAEDEFEAWRIEGRKDAPIINIPQEDFVGEEDRHLGKFPMDKEIITVCAHGDSSKYSADLLVEKGFRARGLEGGMDAWSAYYETHKVSDTPLIYQIYRVAKGCISHVVISGGEAAVIDAIRHTEHISSIIDEHGARVVAVMDTHLQADHVSGGPGLVRKYGAPYYIHQTDAKGARYEHEHIRQGLRIKVGKSELEALHTPGHTPGSTSYLLDGKYLFTGDTVMETSIGRPDLGGQVGPWGRFLYYTLFKRLEPMPEEIIVLPTHAASVKEQDDEGVVRFTLGWARKELDLFGIRDQGRFLDKVKETLLVNPERYADIRQVNLGVLQADEKKLTELEIGKNLCGMSGKGEWGK